ncbi:PREDICTED: uncharacterized protein LOC105363169 [Ceratosolen solmsi marchali]|uniref:Uncharacterized protein LOC105363169 n=1 Tax=Ceratosolen solmsi marchali TaxID=326594 RepID=A0AAJ6YJA2_9HYME|nr:PREDICTED: uncharacterized protein LOC105363169 [Ceratosolen solmsi marchali]
MLRKYIYHLFLLFSYVRSSQSNQTLKLNGKKEGLPGLPLVYPIGGTLKLLAGCTIPIAMPGRILIHSQNIQFQFALPQNATFFSNYFTSRSLRRRRQSDIIPERSIFYQFLEEELLRRGNPGKDCIKRSICESAETPLRDDGLVGEIFHVLLTPDYGGLLGVDEEYGKAAEIGRRGDDCLKTYPSCPEGFGILDRISKIFDHD